MSEENLIDTTQAPDNTNGVPGPTDGTGAADTPADAEIELTPEELKNAKIDTPPAADTVKGADDADGEGEAEDTVDGGEVDRTPTTGTRRANRIPAGKRIAQLNGRLRESESYAQRLERELEEARGQSARVAAAAKVVDRANIDTLERAVTAEERAAKNDLISAKQAGDAEKEADAIARLSAAAAEKSNIQSFKAANPAPDPKAPPQQRADPRRPAAPQVSPEVEAWVGENPWFDEASDSFDMDMHSEAVLYAKQLERRYKNEGKAHLINTPAYFQAVNKHVREEFPDAFETPSPTARRQTPAMARGGSATPAAGAGGGQGNGGAANGRTKVSLTGSERAFAHSLAANGALKNPDGTRPKPEQAERLFALQKLADARR